MQQWCSLDGQIVRFEISIQAISHSAAIIVICFGGRLQPRSVFSFLRLSNAIWYIGVEALNIIWSCFFDDYVVFARDEHTNSTNQTVSLLFKLLGWKFAEEGEKAECFSREFGALGIRIILDGACL